jgi:PAS domain S-box-containing protein
VHWPTDRQVTAQANVLWLQQERKRLRALYEVLPVGYALMDQYGIIHEANRRFESIIGLSPGLLRKTPFSRLVRRDDIPLLLNHFWLRLPAVK